MIATMTYLMMVCPEALHSRCVISRSSPVRLHFRRCRAAHITTAPDTTGFSASVAEPETEIRIHRPGSLSYKLQVDEHETEIGSAQSAFPAVQSHKNKKSGLLI
jgi:hypothetical protein